MRDLAGARIQPAASADVARLGEVADAGASIPVLLTAAPARLTWLVRFPARADFDASAGVVPGDPAAAGVTVRIGLSDDRAYEELARLPLTAHAGPGITWQPIRVDLGAYSGWQWSLFYRPSRINWNLIVAADPTPGGTVAWRALNLRRH
jgi:hypothetical protein